MLNVFLKLLIIEIKVKNKLNFLTSIWVYLNISDDTKHCHLCVLNLLLAIVQLHDEITGIFFIKLVPINAINYSYYIHHTVLICGECIFAAIRNICISFELK
jgi:hypothetical protein